MTAILQILMVLAFAGILFGMALLIPKRDDDDDYRPPTKPGR